MDQQHPTQGRAKWTWILIVIIFATPVIPTKYEIQPLGNNPGLFYAKVEPLRITSTYWRIVVYMDPQHLQAHLQSKNISTDINNVYSTCLDQSIEKDCRSEVRVDLLNGKVKQIENNYEELKNMLTEIKQDTPEVENLPPSMQKRRAPLLGFIRSIIGPVTGVMTSDDAEEYDNSINEVHDRQNNLSKLLRKQTHVVKSEINNIHLELNKKSQEIANIQQQLNKTIKGHHSPLRRQDESRRRNILELHPFVICLDLYNNKSGANKHQLHKRKIGKRLPQKFRTTPIRYRLYCKDEIYHPNRNSDYQKDRRIYLEP